MNHCKTCNIEINSNYCPNCGQAIELNRIDRAYVLNEISSIINFDKGIFYTIRELVIRPGKTIKDFIENDRNRLVKPLIFIIISSLIYTLFKEIFRFEDGYVKYSNTKKTTVTILMDWIQNNYGYANILMGVFIAFWTKLLFKKYKYNFYEILIVLCFVMGIGMLIYSVFGLFESLTGLKVLQIGGIIGFIYISWAIGNFFDKNKKMNYLKALFAYILGFISFYVLVIIIGTLIDKIHS
ncbi:DUF3667 domain-containing protein [uncultured Flavobacterium sp.]|uniref:DUF3667 domain-containing protein n=1 Tax=uncultured Flavobacterium sp. TaxID=165435 RepID=UPI0030ED5AEE